MEVERQLVDTEVERNLLLLGADFAQESGLQQGKPVTVSYKGKTYETKMHSIQKGRIDGLSAMHKDFPDRFQKGDSIQADYEPSTNTVMVWDKIAVDKQLANAVDKQLTNSENQYHILLLGTEFDLPNGKPVTVTYGGKTYQTKTHSVTTGRIDGLSDMYKDFPDRLKEGDSIRAVYNPSTNTIELS